MTVSKNDNGWRKPCLPRTTSTSTLLVWLQQNQTFVERYVYTPYGDRKVLDANFTDDSDNLTDYDFQLGHQGLRIAAESGTYYN